MQTSTDYELHNSKGGQMGYDERRFGVSLGFVGHGGGHFQFKPKGASPRVRDHRVRTVLEDEPLALYNTKTKQYLGVGFPVFGISLKWSKVPLYDWRLRDIKGPRFALYGNGDYLVHGHRTVGINLKWYRDTLPKPEPKPTGPKEYSVALQRQQIVQGHIPYLGQFGGPLDKGKITKIQNASNDMTLLMVKRGRSTEQCGDPSATVRVAPRALHDVRSDEGVVRRHARAVPDGLRRVHLGPQAGRHDVPEHHLRERLSGLGQPVKDSSTVRVLAC